MLGWARSHVRTLRLAVRRLRAQGYGLAASVLLHLPALVLRRGYRKLAQTIAGRTLTPLLDAPRLRRFLRSLDPASGTRFYVIAMPGTLHLLLPCLRLLPPDLDVVLLHNGSTRWERELLRDRYPDRPAFRLSTLPGASIAHGDVLTLLLGTSGDDFGILDHDLYLFDRTVFDRLRFDDTECALGLFGAQSDAAGRIYLLTHFLFFRTSVWRDLMIRHRVTARLRRRAPARLREQLARIGLAEGVFLKDYHDYFDTLHLLLALAYAEGWQTGFVELASADDAVHIGGTSIGLQQTKELGTLYANARFLELECNAALRQRYRGLMGRFGSAAEIRALLPRTPETLRMLAVLDRLIARLEAVQ
jgi:hypothetical protein